MVRLVLVLLGLLGLLTMALPAQSQTWELVWQDEFNGSALDLGKWQAQIGTGCPSLCGWGNNEEQYYRSENAVVSGGFLTITAKKESFGGRSYTSSRLRTRNLGDWKRGRFEMRAKMPIGQGLWPAFWMLPTDEAYGGWAASGEIDILEYLGHQPSRAFGTLHYGGSFPANTLTSNAMTLSSGNFHDTFHDFVLEWDDCSMRWYIDGNLYATQKNWYSEGGAYPAPFNQRFHLLLNLAVGGYLPGSPDQTTVFPQELVVDYVRVYQEPVVDLDACVLLFDGMEHGNPFGNGWFSFSGSVGGGGIDANFVDLPPIAGCSASLQTGWGSGGATGFFGGFGRRNLLDLTGMTHFTLWIHPDAGQEYVLEINLQDDDNGDDFIAASPPMDDEFQYNLTVGPAGSAAVSGGGWQRISIPLTSFVDDNSFHTGGNGILDPFPVSAGGNGQLINVVVTVIGSNGSDATFRTDRWEFTRRTASVAGRVWDDANGNGTQDIGELGLNAVTVELVDVELGAVVASEITSASGDYLFDSVVGGEHQVRVDTATLTQGSMPTFDPDGIQTADEFLVSLMCDQALANGNFGYSTTPTNVPGAVPGRAGLRQNIPNPFNPRTVIAFELVHDQFVEITVYDVAGHLVRTLVRESRPAGLQQVEWDGLDEKGVSVASGLYHYCMQTTENRWVKSMVLLK